MRNMMKVIVPPIKSQGIKTKLIPWIQEVAPCQQGLWIEPFMGTGVVGFNLADGEALLCDVNPHLVEFYSQILSGQITPQIIRNFLTEEGNKLSKIGQDYYYEVRKRFNEKKSPLDFLFLNRSGFNGMIRFNSKGEFNIPFCRKNERFVQAYITKIVNQVTNLLLQFQKCNFTFACQDFKQTIANAKSDDFLYCDPPYLGRYADYYNNWTEEHENELFCLLKKFSGKFILSSWHHNDYRENIHLEKYRHSFNILTKQHYYYVGAKEDNRNSMTEALVTNFDFGKKF